MSRTERWVAVILGALFFAGTSTVIYTSLFPSGPARTDAWDEFEDDEIDFTVGDGTGPLSGLFDEPPAGPAPAQKAKP